MPVKAKSVKTAKAAKSEPKKGTGWLPYRNNEHVRAAKLYNLRGADITEGKGIPMGAIVAGVGGYALAERNVPGHTAKVVKYTPNAVVKLGQAEVPGMVMVKGGNPLNYAVVRLAPGKLHTVELDRFKGQDVTRRANLVKLQ